MFTVHRQIILAIFLIDEIFTDYLTCKQHCFELRYRDFKYLFKMENKLILAKLLP